MTDSPSRITPGSASVPTAASPCDRHLCSVRSLDVIRRPDAHRVFCLLLVQTQASDSEVRAFISQHSDTADVPDWLQVREGDHIETKTFVLQFAFEPKPALLTQLFGFCSRRSGFEEPLIDSSGETVGVLSMEPTVWQQTQDVSRALLLQMEADRALSLRE